MGKPIVDLSKADLPFCEGSYTQDMIASHKRNLARKILNRALERYHEPDAYEGLLVDAAWEIEQIGPEAWPALLDPVMDGGPEVEYFLGTIIRLEGVEPQVRRKALLTAARNPNPDVRSRLLELLEEMPDELRVEVLRELTADGRPDDGVTDRARFALPRWISTIVRHD
jgi:HEAT repeat protein